MDTAPLLELNDGRQMPVLGFGTYSIKDPQVIVQAIDTGYRLLDTAHGSSCPPRSSGSAWTTSTFT